jgi:hypothetical protein
LLVWLAAYLLGFSVSKQSAEPALLRGATVWVDRTHVVTLKTLLHVNRLTINFPYPLETP